MWGLSMMETPQSKSVDFWLKKACGSPKTKRVYQHRIWKFFEFYNVNPDSLVEKWKQARYEWKERERFIDTWVENIEAYIYNNFETYAPMSRASELSTVLSFFQHHRIPLEVDKQKHLFVKYHNRDITKEELKRILEHCKIREKAFFLIMAESGLRPYTIVQLRYRHIKRDFEANKIPMMIELPAEILKDRVGNRFSFIGEDGYNVLKEYLSTRIPLNNDNLVFVRERKRGSGILNAETFSNKFSKTVLKLQLDEITEKGKPKPLRLYCLRKFFRNNIRVDMAFREFWMGHKWGTDEHYLTRNVDRHREVYAEAYESLRIYEQATKEMKQLNEELEKTKEELEALRKQVKYLSSTEYVDKRFKELMEEAMEKLRKENPQWNE